MNDNIGEAIMEDSATRWTWHRPSRHSEDQFDNEACLLVSSHTRSLLSWAHLRKNRVRRWPHCIEMEPGFYLNDQERLDGRSKGHMFCAPIDGLSPCCWSAVGNMGDLFNIHILHPNPCTILGVWAGLPACPAGCVRNDLNLALRCGS